MIFKFQLGGTWVPPLVSYTPVTVTDNGGSTVAALPATSSGESSDLTDKDLMKMMEKLDGLPSDMKALTSALLNFYIDLQYSVLPSTSNIASRYLSYLSQMRTANFNRKEYDDAYNTINANGGINEVAVDERGYLFCMNADRDFKLIKPEELKDNKGYAPLTNSELLLLRAYSPDLAFNSSILGVVKNGIGIQSVTKMITDIISGLGSSESQQQGYISTPSGKLINGIKELSLAVATASSQGVLYNGTTEDLYKYNIIDKNQLALIDNAMAYILNTLPENARSLLKTKTRTGSDDEVKQLIEVLISSQIDTTQHFTLDLDGGPTKAKSSAAKEGKVSESGLPKLDPVSLVQAGYGEKQMITIQTAEGGSNGILVPTVKMLITNKEGKSLGISTLADITESGFAGYLDFENVSMGGTMIPAVGLQNVATNATALSVGYLPVDLEEYERTGNIRPDINLLKRYKTAQQLIRDEKATTPEEINAIYERNKLPVIYSPNGDVMPNYKKFGMLNATAFGEAFEKNPAFDDYIHETDDENVIKNALSLVLKGRNKEDRLSYDSKSWYNSLGIGDYTHVYEGTIFIPINEDYFMSTAGFGQNLTPEQAAVVEARQQGDVRAQLAAARYVKPDNTL